MQASGSSGFLLYRVRALRFSRMKYHMSPVTHRQRSAILRNLPLLPPTIFIYFAGLSL